MKPFTDYLPPHRPYCLCIGDNAPELGEHNLFLPGPANEILPLLIEAGAQYDLVSLCIREPDSMWEAIGGSDSNLVPFMQKLLTPRGNLVLFGRHLFISALSKKHVWLELHSNFGSAVFLSPQHDLGPAVEPSTKSWLTYRKGPYVDATNACPDTARRHAAVVHEYERRNNLRDDAANICMMHDGILLLGTHDFQRFSNKIPLAQKHWVGLFAQRDMDRVMANPQDRAIFRSIVLNPSWKVAPDSVENIKKAFAHHASHHAPLTEQSPLQCLAWLDEAADVTLRDDAESTVFRQRKSYPVRTFMADCTASTERPAKDGTREDIRLEGRTMHAQVIDDTGTTHTFGNEAPESWADFLALFHPPEVPDIATLNQQAYESHKHWLVRFAEFLTRDIPKAV